ncbi:MAG: hypothetical protein KDA90_24435, partial [Planctomycetaceae bacterium]|nr:hypothetical protein [Planctomycetaceae bacterium]
MTDDSMFGTNVTMDVEVRFNGRIPTRFPNAYDTYARRYDQVRRTWAVHTTTEGQKNINVPLINPDTGNPWLITWVDSSNAGGAGTFENPFDALPASAPGHDLVLVRAGGPDTTGNIVLENNQQLLGEGFANFIDTDRLGVIQLPVLQPDGTPGFADAGARPVLAGDAGMG